MMQTLTFRLALPLLGIVMLLVPGCRYRSDLRGPEFKRSSEQLPLRADRAPQRDGTIEFEWVDGSLTRISTVLGLSECQYQFRIKVRNMSAATTDRFRGHSFVLLDEKRRSTNLSGPYGCDDSVLGPGEQCVASFATTVPAGQCAPPTALRLGQATLRLSL